MNGWPQRRWTRLMLRRYALEYLGMDRLPNGLAKDLYSLVGTTTDSRSVGALLNQYRRVPWVL